MPAPGPAAAATGAFSSGPCTEGLQRIDVDLGGPQKTLAEPAQLLRHLKATPTPGIYVLLDFHPYLTTRCTCG